MRRIASILLLVAIAALGSGALRYIHEYAHAIQDAGSHDAPVHDESNCDIHAQLSLPMLADGYVPLLICIGVFVAFLTLLPTPVLSRRPVLRLESRGPPARLLLSIV